MRRPPPVSMAAADAAPAQRRRRRSKQSRERNGYFRRRRSNLTHANVGQTPSDVCPTARAPTYFDRARARAAMIQSRKEPYLWVGAAAGGRNKRPHKRRAQFVSAHRCTRLCSRRRRRRRRPMTSARRQTTATQVARCDNVIVRSWRRRRRRRRQLRRRRRTASRAAEFGRAFRASADAIGRTDRPTKVDWSARGRARPTRSSDPLRAPTPPKPAQAGGVCAPCPMLQLQLSLSLRARPPHRYERAPARL